MSDYIETHGDQATFASFRDVAWHGLGEVFHDEVTDPRKMLELAHLAGWNVRLIPLSVPGIDQDRWVTPAFAVVRDNPLQGGEDVLAVVGQRYKVYQNEELFDWASYLGSGARWETAGSVKGGRVVFGSLALERETVLDPNGVADVVKSYILVNTSHDGSTGVQASITPVRVVCSNTLNFALRAVKQSFKIRHTQSMDGKMAAAREALGLAEVYMDRFDEEAKTLFEAKVTSDEFSKIIEAAYPAPGKDASKAAKTRYANKVERIEDVYRSETTQMIQGNAWGALNALTEDLDWNRGIRNGNEESKLVAASGLDPIANTERNRLFKIVKEFATA